MPKHFPKDRPNAVNEALLRSTEFPRTSRYCVIASRDTELAPGGIVAVSSTGTQHSIKLDRVKQLEKLAHGRMGRSR